MHNLATSQAAKVIFSAILMLCSSTDNKVSYLGLQLLWKASSPSAIHDSATQENAAKSLRKTRHSGIIDHLSSWSQNDDTPISILCLIGPKTNLAHLCAQGLEDSVAASFFFSQELHLDSPETFIPTLAYQLAIHFPAYRPIIATTLRHNPALLTKTLKTQFHELIKRPFQELLGRGEPIGSRRLIIVGALDECVAGRELLRLLSAETAALPFQWIILGTPAMIGGSSGLPEGNFKALTIPDAHRLLGGLQGHGQPGDPRVWVLWLEGDGIWILPIGSIHEVVHMAVLFFFSS
ncbi:hypothetical protein NP233_g9015 [Leucocoprinus birnbaumii]|uniref:Nephrocystin 3-like N-terminal domain-containing protein n=1 Tax=Leucocoprinus birnbaumii TaxID=56174 RepID=A0AAD5VLD1_9AGAR|nr:hypothetical protein NP233_g9015 [Leucocoprinus birnbaumii]